MLTELEAIQWCKQNHAKVEWLERDVSVDAPGFDQIVAENVQEAVQLAVELEQSISAARQLEIPNPSWLPTEDELAEAEQEIRELEESLQAGAQMAQDETEVIKAEMTHGAYFL